MVVFRYITVYTHQKGDKDIIIIIIKEIFSVVKNYCDFF